MGKQEQAIRETIKAANYAQEQQNKSNALNLFKAERKRAIDSGISENSLPPITQGMDLADANRRLSFAMGGRGNASVNQRPLNNAVAGQQGVANPPPAGNQSNNRMMSADNLPGSPASRSAQTLLDNLDRMDKEKEFAEQKAILDSGMQVKTRYGTIGNTWQTNVLKNHPEIGKAGSVGNAEFVKQYKEATASGKPFNPNELAKTVMGSITEKRMAESKKGVSIDMERGMAAAGAKAAQSLDDKFYGWNIPGGAIPGGESPTSLLTGKPEDSETGFGMPGAGAGTETPWNSIREKSAAEKTGEDIAAGARKAAAESVNPIVKFGRGIYNTGVDVANTVKDTYAGITGSPTTPKYEYAKQDDYIAPVKPVDPPDAYKPLTFDDPKSPISEKYNTNVPPLTLATEAQPITLGPELKEGAFDVPQPPVTPSAAAPGTDPKKLKPVI
jgi:hypothetical protein